MLAFYVHDLNPFLLRFSENIGLRWYGLAYIFAFLFGTLLYRNLARRGYSDLTPDQVTDFITWGALFGVVVGGRLGYMLFYDLDGFLQNPLLFFRVWEGGMSSHGGIIGLALYSLWYARRHHVSWLNLGDNLVVVAPIGLFLGRCANFINGELFGRATTVFWAMQFPKELAFMPPGFVFSTLQETAAIDPKFSNVDAVVAGVSSSPALRNYLATILTPRYPSQLIEAFLEGIVLFTLLWLMRTRLRFAHPFPSLSIFTTKDGPSSSLKSSDEGQTSLLSTRQNGYPLPNGILTGTFFIAYALLRIAGEVFREPDAPLIGMFTRGEFFSFFLIVMGIGFIVAAMLRPRYPR